MPIIVTAGLIVAIAAASLLVATQKPLQALGPGLPVTVAISMVVAVTLMPALIAIFGGLLFRTGPAWLRRAGLTRDGLTREAARQDQACSAGERLAESWRRWSARAVTSRPVALIVATVCTAGLAAAAVQVRDMRFAPALDQLQQALSRWPGTAGVMGPANVPAALSAHLTMPPSGHAARYAVVESAPPLSATAISDVRGLKIVTRSLSWQAASRPGSWPSAVTPLFRCPSGRY